MRQKDGFALGAGCPVFRIPRARTGTVFASSMRTVGPCPANSGPFSGQPTLLPNQALQPTRSRARLSFSVDRHRGGGCPPTPATPPRVRVRTRHTAIRVGYASTRLHADALGPSRDFSDPGLEPIKSLRRNDALDLPTGREAESKQRSILRSRHRTLRLIYLELELCRDESRDALHHPLPRPLAANVDVAVVRVSNEAMSTALQFPVESVEHEVAEQWRKWTPLRGALHAWTDQPVLHHPGPRDNTLAILAADPSRPPALLVAYIRSVCALLAPWRPGASTARMAKVLSRGPLQQFPSVLAQPALGLAPAVAHRRHLAPELSRVI